MNAANITPVFQKDDGTDKADYRAISLLRNLSKVLQRPYINNYIFPLIKSFLFSNADFWRVSVLNIVLSHL